MIAGRSQIEFRENPRMWVSCKTIYQWIYHPHQRHRQLWQYLPRAHVIPSQISGCGCVQSVSCSGCPSTNARHTSTTGLCSDIWESDSIVGARSVGEGIHTEVVGSDATYPHAPNFRTITDKELQEIITEISNQP